MKIEDYIIPEAIKYSNDTIQSIEKLFGGEICKEFKTICSNVFDHFNTTYIVIPGSPQTVSLYKGYKSITVITNIFRDCYLNAYKHKLFSSPADSRLFYEDKKTGATVTCVKSSCSRYPTIELCDVGDIKFIAVNSVEFYALIGNLMQDKKSESLSYRFVLMGYDFSGIPSQKQYSTYPDKQQVTDKKRSKSSTSNSAFSLPKDWDETRKRMARGARIAFMIS